MATLGCRGTRAPKIREANQAANKIRLNTESPGGPNEAQQLFDNTKKEFANRGVAQEGIEPQDDGSLRIYSEYNDESLVQLRTMGKSGHPKVEITDAVNKIEEKITFN